MIKEYSNEINFADDYNCYDFDIINFNFSNKTIDKGYIVVLPIKFSSDLEKFLKNIITFTAVISFKIDNDKTIIAINSF